MMIYALKKIPLVTCLVLAVFVLGIVPAHAAENTVPVITASGESSQEYLPDTAHVTFAIETQAATQNEAQTQNASITNRVLAEVLASGIAEQDVKTTNFRTSPLYRNTDSDNRKLPVIIGYRVVNAMTVTLPAGQTGQLIDLALKNGATQVSNVRFSLRDNAQIQQEVISLAVKDAMNKIQAIANALGKRIVRVQSVTELGTSIRSGGAMAVEARYNMDAKEMSSIPTPISSGTVNIMSNVQITVEIE
ncbi:MAG: SIMPL domain-containing protein [Sporomusaceae bacterium]|nr:SIMPL domain-containing protein [Sporomusaceae bacterium]